MIDFSQYHFVRPWWLLAFLPWVSRIGRIYLSPRADGKPG